MPNPPENTTQSPLTDEQIALMRQALSEPGEQIPSFRRNEGRRPVGSNADEWHVFLCEHLDSRAACPNGLTFMAVQIAEAFDEAFEDGRRDGEQRAAERAHEE
jgi:hypothetical protein